MAAIHCHESWWMLIITWKPSASAQPTTSLTRFRYAASITWSWLWCWPHVTGMRMLLKPCAFTLSSKASVTRGLPQDVSSLPVASSVLPRFHPGCIAATCAIASPGTGFPVVVVVVVVVVVGGVPGSPVHVTPLRENDCDAVLVPDQLPLKPKDTEAFGSITAL